MEKWDEYYKYMMGRLMIDTPCVRCGHVAYYHHADCSAILSCTCLTFAKDNLEFAEQEANAKGLI